MEGDNTKMRTVKILTALIALSSIIVFASPIVSSDVVADWDDDNDVGFYFKWDDITKEHLLELDDDIFEDLIEDIMKSIGFDFDEDDFSLTALQLSNASLEFGDGESFEDGVLTSLELEILKGTISFIIESKVNNEPLTNRGEGSHIGKIDEQALKLQEIIGRNVYKVGDEISITADFEMVSIEKDVETYVMVDNTRAICEDEIESEIEQFSISNANIEFTKADNPDAPIEFAAKSVIKKQESEGTEREFPSRIMPDSEYREHELAEIDEFVHTASLIIGGTTFPFEKKASENEPDEWETEDIDEDDFENISDLDISDVQIFNKLTEGIANIESLLNEQNIPVKKLFDVVSNRVANYDKSGGNGGGSNDKGDNGNMPLIIGGAVVGVVAIAGIAIFLMRRQ